MQQTRHDLEVVRLTAQLKNAERQLADARRIAMEDKLKLRNMQNRLGTQQYLGRSAMGLKDVLVLQLARVYHYLHRFQKLKSPLEALRKKIGKLLRLIGLTSIATKF